MIKSDYHVHSSFSSDSQASLKQILDKAVSQGFDRICITDHMDREYPSLLFPFEISLPEYADTIAKLKDEYKNKIKLLFGIELGLRNEPDMKFRIKNYYDSILGAYNFDFIIGSTHILYNADPYEKAFWTGKEPFHVLLDYFQSIIDNVRYYSHFQVYGHLDYIVRYIPNEGKDYNYNSYKEIIDKALRELITHGIGIEVNTSGYRYKLPFPHPKYEVLKRYHELGGEIITVGSDAHKETDLAYGFDKVRELLISVGFKYYTVFEHKNPIFIKL